VVVRNGKEVTKTVTLGRLEDGEKKTAELTNDKDDSLKTDAVTKALGMEFSALSDEARKTFKIKDSVKGVIVTSVNPGSAAAERGLRPGDVVEEVNHQAVEHPGDIAKAIEAAKADSKKPALLLVSNGEGEVRFVAVPVD
jgi:serine protease Do